MDDVDQQSGITLNKAIAVEVFRYEILGETTCYFAEESWSVAPTTDPSDWMCHAEVRPVYVDRCYCNSNGPDYSSGLGDDFYKNETVEDRDIRLARDFYAGHNTICLTAVDVYDTLPTLAIKIISKLNPRSFVLHFIDGMWVVELYDDITKYEASVSGDINNESAIATAICRAALKFVRKIGCPK